MKQPASRPIAGAERTSAASTKATGKRAVDTLLTGPELPYLDMARVAVAHRVTNQHGRTLAVAVSGGALRVLLALVAATDEGGRVRLTVGVGVLFGRREYYEHLTALESAGYLRRIRRRANVQRHGEVTATGQAEAARTGRAIERAARAFISGATHQIA